MSTPEARVTSFLIQRGTMLGLDPDHIHAANHSVLRVSDLKALLDRLAAAEAEVAHWKAHAEEAGAGFAQVCRDYAKSAARTVSLVDVHARYFDLDGEPGTDDTTPEPEDVWRYDRDFRVALDDPQVAGDAGGGDRG